MRPATARTSSTVGGPGSPNEEVLDFCRWLRAHNLRLDPAERVGFHGLDVYSLWESLREILIYLREHDPEQVPVALAAYRCFEPYGEDAQSYAYATRFAPQSCENEVVDLLVLVGFGTHRGSVIAGDAWGAPMRGMPVPPARPGSVEDALHRAAPPAAVLTFPEHERIDLLTDELDHRAIGVVYHPEREHWGNYVPTVLGDRYDAFLWFDETTALHPLPVRRTDVLEPETYPSGT